MNIRKILFDIKNIIDGRTISLHYNQLVNFYNNNNNNNNEKSLNTLSNLLIHAKENVEFYNKFETANILDFPIVNKGIIKSSADKFKAKNYFGKKLIKMTTSGSTGTPFSVYQDLNKKDRNHADTIYFGSLGGYELGNKLLYLKIWAKQKMSNPFVYKIQNIIPIDVITLSDKQIQDIITKVQSDKINKYSILGYVSALEQIVKYCESFGINTINTNNITGIVTMSEALSNGTKVKLQKIFNCSVVSRYSNLENGIIAQQLINENRFLVNTASYFVEILAQDSEQVLTDGSLGRIVITDLYNYAMPMIRYNTGDLGSIEKEGGYTYLKTVEGRKLDVLFDTKGQLVSSYIMYKNMWQYNEINQYQLIQTAEKKYLFKINCDSYFTKENQLVAEFKEYLGEDADLKVEYVKEIPLLDSGKRRKTVNLYKKSIS